MLEKEVIANVFEANFSNMEGEKKKQTNVLHSGYNVFNTKQYKKVYCMDDVTLLKYTYQ